MSSVADPSFFFEIDILHFDAVSVYMGPQTKNPETKFKEDNFSTLCKYLAGSHTPRAPKVRQIVGVYSRLMGKWVRGKVVKVTRGLDGDEYQVFLLDYGKYIKVPLPYLICDCIKQTLDFPANFTRICLLDVIPTVPLNSEVKMFLFDQFHKGRTIVRDIVHTKKLGLIYGNIYIKVRGGGQMLDLKALLLDQGYVKYSYNFVIEMRQMLECEGIDLFDDLNVLLETSPAPPQPNVGDMKYRYHRRSSSPKRSSGYSSYEGVRCVPAGLHEPHVKRDKSKGNSGNRSCSNLKVEKLYSYRSPSVVGQPIPEYKHFDHKEVSWVNEDKKEGEELIARNEGQIKAANAPAYLRLSKE